MRYLKGDIFYCNFGKGNIIDNEQRGIRPVMIIQNDVGNKYSPNVIVATITSQDKTDLPTHVELHNYPNLKPKCTILLEQVRTVSKNRLGSYLTKVTLEDMIKVDKAMLISLGIDLNNLARF